MVLKKAVGIRQPKQLSNSTVISLAAKLHLEGNICILDTSYLRHIKSLDSSSLTKLLVQPMQLIYFKNDTSRLFLVNCYVGGFPNLKWNRTGTFNNFPPIANGLKQPDTNLVLSEFKKYVLSADGSQMPLSSDILIVTFNNFMFRQSKILTSLTGDYSEKNKIPVIYINNDALIYKIFNTSKALN